MSEEKPVWQPIETAPRDYVTTVDLWANGERVPDCFWGHPSYHEGPAWVHVNGYDCDGEVLWPVQNPTHWMPLPEPPEEA